MAKLYGVNRRMFVDGVDKGAVWFKRGRWFWQRGASGLAVEPFARGSTLRDVEAWAATVCNGKTAKVKIEHFEGAATPSPTKGTLQMARTPSLSAAEAEALIGPRGSVKVTSDNRGLVKKWLVALGLPSDFVGGLSLIELELAYRDDTGVQKVKDKLAKSRAEMGEDGEDGEPAGSAAPANGHPAPVLAGGSDAAELGALLRRLMGSSVDEARVRQIVEEQMGRIPTVRIEVVRGNGEVHQVDGHHHPKFATLLKMATVRQHDGYVPGIFIAGETSSGKTTGGKMLAAALGLPWHFNGAISMPHEMLGFIDAGGTYHRTPFRDAYEHGGVFTFDEVDRSDPNALLAVNPHLANGVATFPDGQIKRHKDCLLTCTANTWGLGANADYAGATKLDAAFVGRFPLKLSWDIDEVLERAISGNEAFARRVQAARARARTAGLRVLICMRQTQAGAALINAGMSSDEAAELTYLANLKPEQRTIVEGR